MKIIKHAAVEPVSSSQANETLSVEADSTKRQNAIRSSTVVRRQSSRPRVPAWLTSMSFDDKRLELMYDRYVVKFGDYSVNMLILLLSLGCLTELILYFVAGSTSKHIIAAVMLLSLIIVLILTLVTLLLRLILFSICSSST